MVALLGQALATKRQADGADGVSGAPNQRRALLTPIEVLLSVCI